MKIVRRKEREQAQELAFKCLSEIRMEPFTTDQYQLCKFALSFKYRLVLSAALNAVCSIVSQVSRKGFPQFYIM